MVKVDIPVAPPVGWFSPPTGGIPTDKRITIEPDGRVYGYIALWDTCHVGHGDCITPPKGSPTDYEYAHQGETLTAEGDLLRTAVIAGGMGHAPVDMNTAMVPAYYENTGTQLMRVRYGEDQNGLWFAGALWPEVSELQVAQIRASSISGDWRVHAAWRTSGNTHDFAGACFVNIPGFPMPREGSIQNRPGRPYALAASAVELEDSELLVFEDGKPLTGDSNMDEDEKCDGNCEHCTCGELTEEQENEVLQAAYQVLAKRKKKKPDTISADGSGDSDNETESENEPDLQAQLNDIKTAVDWLVADKLAQDILKDTEVDA